MAPDSVGQVRTRRWLLKGLGLAGAGAVAGGSGVALVEKRSDSSERARGAPAGNLVPGEFRSANGRVLSAQVSGISQQYYVADAATVWRDHVAELTEFKPGERVWIETDPLGVLSSGLPVAIVVTAAYTGAAERVLAASDSRIDTASGTYVLTPDTRIRDRTLTGFLPTPPPAAGDVVELLFRQETNGQRVAVKAIPRSHLTPSR